MRLWLAFIVSVGVFSRLITSVQPKGYYADLLGPEWVTAPILLTRVLAVPLAVAAVCSVLERTSALLVTKMNVLVLIYVYGAYLVEWTSVPADASLGSRPESFHYVGPTIHGVLALSAFALEYVIVRWGQPRVAADGAAPRR
jgi:hypothetical protein